uniref:Uncharacterized protein n=1 Tax=Aureoumbra lagunensis TaxID=44058 RepID=A0A7S3NGQ8_9STRA|mmetsp:Transcript_21031/g.27265  ORF Transcript_21031/g.27265 Transcript_21031/m.27265 type:complete len:281 (+) Transcript_21031:45-887(+)|eukprot:CAMPEP_0197291082 /NCGR_PEP_ID=MMETSP0890-20130614/11642_1 /TAXON_ID=44058 ORGANISM="Aureoumbra lagunensis, Strain CCMP1510" /NCGR_SAMPLE_ID=MMETSP0890 /ASSEMBLY_ACC=CAM_ASM_000533 /LENGTH=280 /DNA_ID=CAMNT_0042763631 /DNA_START=45 /DNA_END=887 /DNA_ORIENTATION=-
MGNEQSSNGGIASWGATSCTGYEQASGFNMLVSCACSALGDVNDEVDDMTMEELAGIPANSNGASRTSRSMRSHSSGGGRVEELPLQDNTTMNNAPMSYEEATGTARLESARRSRAAEVRESEAVFLREFLAMMKTGLTLLLRHASDGSMLPVHLLLVPSGSRGSAIEWHYRDESGHPQTGRLPVQEVAAVQPNPQPAELGFQLAARSFIIVNQSGDALLFHADTTDVCSLLVDGLLMLVKKIKKRALRKRGGSLPPNKKKVDDETNTSQTNKTPLKVKN